MLTCALSARGVQCESVSSLFDQNFKYNIPIRKVLEKIISSYKGDKNTQEYKDFLEYTKRVFFSNGIHHHYAEDKIIPKCSQPYFKSLMVATGQEDKCAKLLPIIYDPTLYAQRQYTGKDGDLIAESSVNFYEDGITKDEVNSFYDKTNYNVLASSLQTSHIFHYHDYNASL